ncbi:MAG TPA: site-2 protease family protein [Planctomycetota bacterium]|nr:site-2 protease family protein [Planctomycetota bacterium]
MFRIFGIAVRMHWVMALTLAYYFAQAVAGGWLGVGLMAVTQAILIASILFHELGHCWMAIRHRGHAEKILLWPLGGLSYLEYDRRPQLQIQVSIIGPISSLLLSAICFGILRATDIPLDWNLAHPLRSWYPMGFTLAQILILHAARLNLILGLFNVIPAYPLDGGQVLQAFLTLKIGRLRAAQVTSAVSIVVGAAMVFFGFVRSEILLTLIGLNILFAAHQLRSLIRMGELDAHPSMGGGGSSGEFDYMPERPRKKGFWARWKEKRSRAAAARDLERDQAGRARVDAVLEKVSREGIGSLTSDEKRILDEASRRSRGEA